MNAISKKLLSLVIVLAMVLSMAPVITLPAAAATEVTEAAVNQWITNNDAAFDGSATVSAPCPFCGEATVNWTAIDSTKKTSTYLIPRNGGASAHYYISEDITYEKDGGSIAYTSSSYAAPCGIYLNDHTITATAGATVLVNAGLNLIAGQGGIVRNDSEKTTLLFRMTGTPSATVNIYGGTYESKDEDAEIIRIGGTMQYNLYGAKFKYTGEAEIPIIEWVKSTSAVNMYGGSIECGNGYLNTNTDTIAGTVNLQGGTVTGKLSTSGGTLKLSGELTVNAPGLAAVTTGTVDVTDLAAGSSIAVTGAQGDTVATTGGSDAIAKYFTVYTAGVASAALEVTNSEGTLTITEKQAEEELPEWSSDIPTRINQWTDFYGAQFTGEDVETAICPVCGATDVTWKAVSARPLPSAGAHLYFYSEGTTEITAGSLDQIGTSHAATHCIYLNNYAFTSEGTFAVRDTLNIFDDPDVAGGSITDANSTNATATYEKNPSFRLFSGAKLNVYYGTYTCAQAKYTNTSDTVVNPNGTPLIGSYADGAQAYIYGATLQNTGYGEVLRSEDNVTVELENCTLKGGSGYVDGENTYGGNIYMTDGTVTLKNTTVTGGTATNGSVYVGGGTLKLAGTTSIATNGLTLGTDVYADVTDLATTSGAIVVNGTKDQKIAVNGDADKAAMFTAPEGLEVTVDGTDLVLTEPEVVDPGPDYADGDTTIQKINKFTAYYAEKFAAGGNVETTDCPVCGATSVTWRPKTTGGLTPRTENDVQVATHWYLGASWERSTSQEQLGGSHAAPLCVYLNGNTFKSEGRLLVKDQLNIFDNASNAGGIIKPTHNLGSESYTKLALFDVYGGELNIYGGQYDSQQANVIAGQNDNGTPVIQSHHSGSVVNIYGGTFKNTGVGTVIDLSLGAVTMTGGTLQSGTGYVETTTTTTDNGDGTTTETETATGNTLGGNVYITGGTFTSNGGTIQNGTASFGGNVYVAADGAFTLTTGNITGGKATDTDSENDGGGNVANFGTFTMNGGSITGGEATVDGGNVYNKGDCTLTGTISGGKATNGGNVYARAKFTTTAGANIFGGVATGNGGNIFIRTCSVDLLGGTITGGKATNGGNIYKYGSTAGILKIDGATVSGGEATGDGATIYVNNRLNLVSGSIIGGTADGDGGAVYLAKGIMNMSGGTITGGVCGEDAEAPTEVDQVTGKGGNGGAVYVAADTTFNMTGGSITGGTVYCKQKGKADGGVTLTEGTGGAVLVKGTFNMSGENTSITGGTARDTKGSCLYVTGKAYLSGGTITGTNDVTDSALIVTGGSSLVNLSGDVDILANNGQAMRVISSGTVNIEPTWTGTAYAMIVKVPGWEMGAKIGTTSNDVFTMDYVQCGTYDAEDNWTACGENSGYNGNLYQYTNNGSKLFALADGSFQVAGGAYVNGNETKWCVDSAATIEEATEEGTVYDYMWLIGDVTLNGETITVDASGSSNVTLYGTGTVNGIDLANTDYKTNSDGLAVDIDPATNIAFTKDYTFGGKRYIALNQGAWTFHCLDLKLSHITLRPNQDNENGLYYKSTITCDPTLAGAVEAYGVALNKSGVLPGNDFAEQGDVFSWTEITTPLAIDDTTTTVTVRSAFVKGILKDTREAANNVAAGQTKISANGYLAIDTDGEDGPEFYMANAKSYSLYDVLGAINTKWANYETNWVGIGGFYKHWQDKGLSAWDNDFASIAAYAETLQN